MEKVECRKDFILSCGVQEMYCASICNIGTAVVGGEEALIYGFPGYNYIMSLILWAHALVLHAFIYVKIITSLSFSHDSCLKKD